MVYLPNVAHETHVPEKGCSYIFVTTEGYFRFNIPASDFVEAEIKEIICFIKSK